MGWIPKPGSGTRAATGRAAQLGAQVAERHPELGVLLFGLDADLDPQRLRVRLAAQLAEVGVTCRISVAGPNRVQAVLSGAMPRQGQVLVVLARSDQTAQDRLMDLVEWLIANGREPLARHLVFVPVGPSRTVAGSFPFRHVPLATLEPGLTARGGAPGSWRTASGQREQLLLAVLDQALGLE
ncbi:hypothetical protein OK351_15985 [Glutamicibacter sp. MNS18]|uniref:hypothetical protein n=1 Tax=Glutamicibacter sp. MNS18 TaxID=2989817 RepID=UPI0022360FDE|nr:hypothetical protein [Glutamicibacter sp. MNS18]MCW4466986.1 hypothetical protein [Glutamicibacter sp. MNS18]